MQFRVELQARGLPSSIGRPATKQKSTCLTSGNNAAMMKRNTNLSKLRTVLFPELSHCVGKHARIALGSTYSAISPRLLPLSIPILAPQTRQPARMHPWGPSQKSCETHGNKRAINRVRTQQTVNHIDEINVDRKAALRKSATRVGRGLVRRPLGLDIRGGRTWTCHI